MAQLGVQLLLFSLGLEFSLSRLSAMRNVALLGERPAGLGGERVDCGRPSAWPHSAGRAVERARTC